MSSIFNKRLNGDPKQTFLTYKYTGQVRILQACLNYKGTPGPLTCSVDGDNVRKIAEKSKVKDIVTMYDTGSTELYANVTNFKKCLKEMVSRSKEGDIVFVQYSGHGVTTDNTDGKEKEDQAFNFRNQKGEDEYLVDDQIAGMLGQILPNWLPCVFFVDACHSGSILDLEKSHLYQGKHVILFSGCQDNQYSQDTGNGGVMTDALLSVLALPQCIEKRKKRNCSLQYIFNKMIDFNTNNPLPPQEQKKAGNLQKEEWPEEEEQIVQPQQGGEQGELRYCDGVYYIGDKVVDYEGEQFDELQQFWHEDEFLYEYGKEVEFHEQAQVKFEPVHEEKPKTDLQYFNLSWNQGTDPTGITFPF